MKQISLFGFAFLLIVGLNSCTLEKRHYRNGYYFSRGNGNHVANEIYAEQKEETQTPDTQSQPIVVADTSIVSVNDSAIADSVVQVSRIEQSVEAISERVYQKLPKKVQSNPPRIEKDKKQATGAGVAAAIFFILAMAGLIIKGTAPPTGIFIIAAFVCCVLCIMLASFLYPRDPVVKQPKDEAVVKNKGIAAVGVGLLIAAFLVFVLFFGLLLSIFTDLLY